MESVYKNMQPSPSQKDQMYYRPYCYPGMEAIRPQMHMNSARPPMGYGWWPWGGNYGGAPPSVRHSCCNHSYLPAQYAWGSPCAHVPQYHCTGNYPSFPFQYMPPPPFYGMEQPRYEYEKNNFPRDYHCCGCSNHPFYDKGQNSVRIEEEEPERKRKSFDSLVPFRSNNSPDPVVWIPPDHSGKKEQEKEGSHDAKAQQHPAFWNGWRPLDMNSLDSTKNRGDAEDNNQHGDGNRDFPFPLFWIPYKPEEKEGEKYKMKDGNTTQSLDGEQNVHLNKENCGDQAAVKLRDIPVKEVSQHVEIETSKNQEKGRNDGEKVEKGTSRKSPSPPKSSKLPPVCLRVDPLPRKKSGNGSSQPNDARKVVKSSENKGQAKILHTELNKDMGAKTVKVVDGRISHGNNTDVKVEAPVKTWDDILTNQAGEKPREGQISQNHAENDAVVKSQSEDAGSTGSKNGVREKKLSEEEAAVVIQSVYRGFDVRKWELIKKLKQIAKVREQMAEVELLVQALKSSSDVQGRSKQRNAIAETIMSLLLKLDTIQGVHPSIRGVRKSTVKELVSLQEQLDSLMNEQPDNSPGQGLIITRDDDASNESGDVLLNGNETSPTHQNQLDGGSNHESSEISEADLVGERAIEKVEKEAAEGFGNNGVESASAPIIEKDEKNNLELENEDLVLAQASELLSQQNHDSAMAAPVPPFEEDKKSGHEDPVLDQGSVLLSLQNGNSAKATDESTKLPIGVLDDLSAEEDSKDEAVEADASNVDQAKQLDEALIESLESHEIAEDRDSNQTMETQEVSDPPFNRVDEETCSIKGPLNHEPDDNLGSKEEVDSRNGDVGIEPDEASEEIENCSCNKDNTELTPQSVITAINDSEVASQASEGCTEQGSFGENVTDPTLQNDTAEATERNKILMEENERLREMMERLIKSGQEQLTAISSLSGRVKDLEKKLSRKKKLKLKQHKPPKATLHV